MCIINGLLPVNLTTFLNVKKTFELYSFLNRSRENLSSRGRDFGRESLGLRDGSEMVVSDACVKGKLGHSFVFFYLLSVKCFFLCFL